MKATLVKVLGEHHPRQELFACDPPMRDYNSREHRYVVASAIVARDTGKPETYFFPADKDGKIVGWGELPGSRRGTLDIDVVLGEAGYEVER